MTTCRSWPKAAGAALRAGRIARDSMSPRDAALAAHQPGGPSVDELEALIIRHRQEARAALQQAAA